MSIIRCILTNTEIQSNRPEDEAWDKILDTFFQETHFTEEEKKFVDEQPVVEIITKAIEYGIKVGTYQQMECEKEALRYMFTYLREHISEVFDVAQSAVIFKEQVLKVLDNIEQGKEGDS